jgi:diaphanous 1
MAPLVNAATHMPTSERHFSSFPMTSHLHTPVLRLVSLNPMLSINLTFLRIPEIHDSYEYKCFISTSMTVSEVIDAIMEELGLTKSLPIPGGGSLEYVMEEVWVDKNTESTIMEFCISTSWLTSVSRVLEASYIYSNIQRRWISVLPKSILKIRKADI